MERRNRAGNKQYGNNKLFDNNPGGKIVAPYDSSKPNYNVRAINRYCKENNINSSELTDEQIKEFIL